MFAFAVRMLKDKYKTLLIYCVGAVAFLEMYVALFPTISKQSSQFDQMLKTMPAEFFKAMNMDPNTLSFSTMESYLSTEYMSFLWPILAIVFAISIANYISINEIDKGTIESLASLPANRIRIFFERYFTGLLILLIFCLVSYFGVAPLAELHSADYVLKNYLTASIGSFLLVWAIYSLATLFSVMFSEKSKATMASSSILIVMYVLNVIAGLKESLENLKYFSFFHYFNGSDLLIKNIYPEYSAMVLGGFAVAVMIISAIWFSRRDLSV